MNSAEKTRGSQAGGSQRNKPNENGGRLTSIEARRYRVWGLTACVQMQGYGRWDWKEGKIDL